MKYQKRFIPKSRVSLTIPSHLLLKAKQDGINLSYFLARHLEKLYDELKCANPNTNCNVKATRKAWTKWKLKCPNCGFQNTWDMLVPFKKDLKTILYEEMKVDEI